MRQNVGELQDRLVERILVEIENGGDLEPGSRERSNNVQDVARLVEALNIGERDDIDEMDKIERRRIEEKKNEENFRIEKAKLDVNWKRMVIEIAKIGVPLITAIMYVHLYRESRDIAGHMEETGRYTTIIGRETALPRIFRW